MTADPAGWPDPARPGVPLHPARDGWHWMLVTHGIGHAFPMLWDAGGRMWDAGDAGWTLAEDISTRWRYLGPCLTPADLAAERAAAAEAMREACAADLDAQAAYYAGVAKNLTGQNRINFEHYAVLHRESANDIRALLIPSASALAERDERMRELTDAAHAEAARLREALKDVASFLPDLEGASRYLRRISDMRPAMEHAAALAQESDA